MDNPEVENNQPENVEQNPEVESKQNIDVETLQQKLEEAEATKQRLLNEAKANKKKYQTLREEIEKQEKQKLEKSENWKELLEKEKNEKFEISEQMKELKQRALEKSLQFEVAKYATDAHKVERVISAVLDSDLVQVSEDQTSFTGVKEAIEQLRNDETYLFKTAQPASMANKAPSATAPKTKSFDEMADTERQQIFKGAVSSIIKQNQEKSKRLRGF